MAKKRTPEKSARQRRLDKLGKGPSLDGGLDEPTIGLAGCLSDLSCLGCGLGCAAFGVLAVALLAAALAVAFIHGCQ